MFVHFPKTFANINCTIGKSYPFYVIGEKIKSVFKEITRMQEDRNGQFLFCCQQNIPFEIRGLPRSVPSIAGRQKIDQS